MIARRLARLDARAIEWLRVAAVIGRDFDAELLERVASLDEDEFLNALEEALAAGLVVESPRRAGALQLLARADSGDPLRGDVGAAPGPAAPPGRRGARAVRAASATSTRWPSTSRARPTLEDAEKAIRYALRAGEQATAMLAHEEAAEHYARALEVLRAVRPRRRRPPLRAAAGARRGAGARRASGRWPGRRSARRRRWRPGSATAMRWRGPRSAPRGATSSRPASSTRS